MNSHNMNICNNHLKQFQTVSGNNNNIQNKHVHDEYEKVTHFGDTTLQFRNCYQTGYIFQNAKMCKERYSNETRMKIILHKGAQDAKINQHRC